MTKIISELMNNKPRKFVEYVVEQLNQKRDIVLTNKKYVFSEEIRKINESQLNEGPKADIGRDNYHRKLAKHLKSNMPEDMYKRHAIDYQDEDDDRSRSKPSDARADHYHMASILDKKLKKDNKKLNVYRGDLDDVLDYADIGNEHGVTSDSIRDNLNRQKHTDSYLSRGMEKPISSRVKRKATNESQLNELSDKKLNLYLHKAKEQYFNTPADLNDPKNRKTFNNRSKGINMAMDKLERKHPR